VRSLKCRDEELLRPHLKVLDVLRTAATHRKGGMHS